MCSSLSCRNCRTATREFGLLSTSGRAQRDAAVIGCMHVCVAVMCALQSCVCHYRTATRESVLSVLDMCCSHMCVVVKRVLQSYVCWSQRCAAVTCVLQPCECCGHICVAVICVLQSCVCCRSQVCCKCAAIICMMQSKCDAVLCVC